ncbi:MAG: repressor LexA [Parachlamydiaceae bacterium]|nr:repressor LexA [Parachlamydiaceae bacterium]
MKGLTQKQRDILNFIQNYIKEKNFSPSYRDIMEHFSLTSPGSVYNFIQTLKRKGALSNEKQCSRSLMPTETIVPKSSESEIQLPFIGNISGGIPIEMFVQSQTLTIPALLVPHPENTYILRAEGSSLNEELICDGDLLLVEARQEAQPGEIIVGLINQNETIIKKYYSEGLYIRLEGHTHHSLTVRAETLLVQGVLVGLIRTY